MSALGGFAVCGLIAVMVCDTVTRGLINQT